MKFKRKKVFFLLNTLEEYNFDRYVRKYLPSSQFRILIGTELPRDSEKYSIIIPWSYRRQIPNTKSYKNLVIFHTSDLPQGRGWSPIANLFLNETPIYTMTGFLPNSKIDDGDVILKLSFPMKSVYTAAILRKWDEELSVIATRILLDKFDGNELSGKEQINSQATYFEKRNREMGELNPNNTLIEDFNLLRSAEEEHPCFIIYRGEKFRVTIEPMNTPSFPQDVRVVFPRTGEEVLLREFGIIN